MDVTGQAQVLVLAFYLVSDGLFVVFFYGTCQAGCPGTSGNFLSAVSPEGVLGLQLSMLCIFYFGSEGLNSGSHTCTSTSVFTH